MEIRLDLSRHCIETAARLKAERLIRSYFKNQEQKIESKIDALNQFLEAADFQELRTRISRTESTTPAGKINDALLIISTSDPKIEIRFPNQSIQSIYL